MNNQTEQNTAIRLGNEYVLQSDNMVLTAAKCGKALVAVKEKCKKGEYTTWIKENMPVGERQCQKFVKLFNLKPKYAEDTKLDSLSLFDIDSEIKLASADDDVEKQLREENKKHKMTRNQVLIRIKELEGENTPSSTKKSSNQSKPLSKICSHTKDLKREIESAINTTMDEAGLKQWNQTIKDMETSIKKIKIGIESFEKEKKRKVTLML